jgi:hypothetical protein
VRKDEEGDVLGRPTRLWENYSLIPDRADLSVFSTEEVLILGPIYFSMK